MLTFFALLRVFLFFHFSERRNMMWYIIYLANKFFGRERKPNIRCENEKWHTITFQSGALTKSLKGSNFVAIKQTIARKHQNISGTEIKAPPRGYLLEEQKRVGPTSRRNQKKNRARLSEPQFTPGKKEKMDGRKQNWQDGKENPFSNRLPIRLKVFSPDQRVCSIQRAASPLEHFYS